MRTTERGTIQVRGRVRVERGAKRIRAYLGGELVADTTRPLLVWEKPAYPTYYFPASDVRADRLSPDGGIEHSPSRGDGETFTIRAGDKEAAGAALRYTNSPFEDLRDAIRLDWHAMDAWFEEDEQVFTHPRDPYTRVDILPSSRHVRIEVDGVTVAETAKPTLLFETGLPDSLLRAEDTRPHGPARADRNRTPLPLQGRRRVLVAARRRYGRHRTSPGRTGPRCRRARRSRGS